MLQFPLLLLVFLFYNLVQVDVNIIGQGYILFGNCNYTGLGTILKEASSLTDCALHCSISPDCNAFVHDGLHCKPLRRCPSCCSLSNMTTDETLYCLKGKVDFTTFSNIWNSFSNI